MRILWIDPGTTTTGFAIIDKNWMKNEIVDYGVFSTTPKMDLSVKLLEIWMDMKDIIKKFILDEFDHRNLNLDCNPFKNLNPTAENIAFVIWGILREQFDEKYQITVDLFETEKNKVSYSGK